MLQAQVLWPADMPDDMLEDAIQSSKQALDENDFEEKGVDVSIFILSSNIITAKYSEI